MTDMYERKDIKTIQFTTHEWKTQLMNGMFVIINRAYSL